MLIMERLAKGAIRLIAIHSSMMSTIAECLAEGAGRPVHVLARQPVADAALVELVAARGEPGEYLGGAT